MTSWSRGRPVLPVLLVLVGATGCNRFRADVEMHGGAVCYHSGDLQCAIDHYTRATQYAPDMQTAWKNLAYSYWSAYNPDDTPAIAKANAKGCTDAFGQYVKLHEDDAHADVPEWVQDDDNARGLMVQMWEQSKDYDSAIGYFEERLRLNAQDDLAMLRLGELNAEAGNWKTALDWYNRRADLNAAASPNVRADIYYTIGTACFQRLHNRPEINGDERVETSDEGLDGLMKAQGLRPDHGPTYVYINLLYRERSLGEPDTLKRDADLQEAQYYYVYSKWMMTRAPITPTTQPASQAAASQPKSGSASLPTKASASQPAASQAAASQSVHGSVDCSHSTDPLCGVRGKQ